MVFLFHTLSVRLQQLRHFPSSVCRTRSIHYGLLRRKFSLGGDYAFEGKAMLLQPRNKPPCEVEVRSISRVLRCITTNRENIMESATHHTTYVQ